MFGIDLVTLFENQHGDANAHPTQDHQTSAMAKLEQYNGLEQIRAFEQQERGSNEAEDSKAGSPHKTSHSGPFGPSCI
jgi:hypothetical protein